MGEDEGEGGKSRRPVGQVRDASPDSLAVRREWNMSDYALLIRPTRSRLPFLKSFHCLNFVIFFTKFNICNIQRKVYNIYILYNV